jgi:uncharacterized protein with GYD domain
MATYVMLSRLTAEGAKTVKETPERIKEINREVETLGAKVVVQYALLGPYDFITILEAPNPETVARISVELGRRGAAHYETFSAIPVETFIASLKPPR